MKRNPLRNRSRSDGVDLGCKQFQTGDVTDATASGEDCARGRRRRKHTPLQPAAGFKGSCAEYLHNTVSHLEALGIRDRYLWELQARVAAEIDRL
jgi:hypothetical protein